VSAKSGGKAPRRAVPKKATSASKPPKRSGYKTEAAIRQDMPSWEKRSSGKWTSGQAYTLAPGSEQGVARRRNTKKYVARTKHVIRPRITKRPKADN
jgi:hypothetical protein